MKWKNLIKSTIFLIIFAITFSSVSSILTRSYNNVEHHWMTGIYEEPENTLDAVYLGSSNCFAFWNQNIAWEEYGIAVTPYTCSSQPLLAAEYLIKEARKTQPDAVYIVNINTLDSKVSDAVMHLLLDNMPFSKNKIEMTEYLCDLAELTPTERLEFYFPIIRFHTNWSEIRADTFSNRLREIKGGNNYLWYFERINNISANIKSANGTCELSKTLKNSIESLLDYCENENVKVVFVAVPRAERSKIAVKRINTVSNIISERGFTVLDLREKYNKIGLDFTNDYYNDTHTNIHGSIKFTYYISEYLVKTYGLKNKRNDKAYSSWENSYNKYYEYIKPYVLSIELDSKHRMYDLEKPENLKLEAESDSLKVTWKANEKADGYTVFRRVNTDAWEEITDTTGTSFVDNKINSKNKYTYTVAPFVNKNGEKYYGVFSYKGVSKHE